MNAVGFRVRNVSLIPVQPRPGSRESCCQINVKNLQLGEESVFGYSAPFLLAVRSLRNTGRRMTWQEQCETACFVAFNQSMH